MYVVVKLGAGGSLAYLVRMPQLRQAWLFRLISGQKLARHNYTPCDSTHRSSLLSDQLLLLVADRVSDT